MGLHEDMAATADAIYAAALGQIDWRDAIDRVLAVTGYTACNLFAMDRHAQAAATDSYRLPVTGFWHGHDPLGAVEYVAEYYKYNLSRSYRLRHPGSRLDHDLMYGRDAELDRNPFYAWAEKFDLRYFMVAWPAPNADLGVSFGLSRPRRMGPAGAAEVERVACLNEHMQRAVQIEHRMGKALAAHAPSADFLDRNPNGIVLLDGFGRVVLANRSARAMAEAADSFTLERDAIRALRPVDDEALKRVIAAAIRTADGNGHSSGGTLRLPRRSGKRSYVIVAAPLSRRESVLSELAPRAVLMISDPDQAPTPSAALLQQTYGITPAEARLVQRLTAGDTLELAARTLGVSLPTVRTQLASVFRKTETSRQAELVQLLVTLPWWAQVETPKSGG